MSKSTFSKLALVTLVMFALLAWGCEADEDDVVDNGINADGGVDISDALVITSDYTTGGYSLVNEDTLMVTPDVNTIPSDSVCRFDPITQKQYVISRLGSDSVLVLDSVAGFDVAFQYSVGADTNAQDMAVVSAEKAYVTRFASAEVLIVHPTEGTHLGTVDLSAYADADGVPEATGIFHLNGEVFVVLQKLNSVVDPMVPTGAASVVVLDAATDAVKKEIVLTGLNPATKLRYSSAMGSLVLVEVGSYGVTDGGIEFLNLANHSLSGLVVTEESMGGDIVDAVIVSPTKGYAVLATPTWTTNIVSFNPSTGQKIADLIVGSDWEHSYLELKPDGGQLWVSSRVADAPGLRVFDTTTDTELTTAPINVGLPPTMTCFAQ